MADIRHRVGIKAPQEDVYKAVATREGVATWWTRTVEGDSTPGGQLRFFFGYPQPAATMEIRELTPNERVVWRCVQGPDEWVNTDLTFEVKSADGETALVFTHASWREPVEFMNHCSTKWAIFLMSLKQLVETGAGAPAPHDVRISNWL